MALEKLSNRHVRVAVVGNVDAGKSTLIGTIASGTLDDGRGSGRSFVIKHPHELQSGRTSCITSHTVEYDGDGAVVNIKTKPKRRTKKGPKAPQAPDVIGGPGCCVTFMDMAGHEKYLKTTISGISGGMADYAIVLVNSMQPPTHMTFHHLNLCIYNGIPVIVVLTKIDHCPPHVFKATLQAMQCMLRSPDIGFRPYRIKKESDIDVAIPALSSVVPILTVSTVSGEGLELLHKFLRALPQRRKHGKKIHKPFEYLVEDTFHGNIISGFVNRGRVHVGDTISVGSTRATVRSIHVARNDVKEAWAGHSACLALSFPDKKRAKKNVPVRRGMIAVKDGPVLTHRRFTAEVYLLRGRTVTIVKGCYEATVHILHMKLAARVIDIVKHDDGDATDEIHQGGRATVTFEFSHHANPVRQGMRIILRDGHARGFGVITSVAD